MSHSDKKKKPAEQASVQQIQETQLPSSIKPEAVITSRSNISIYIIMAFAVILISLKLFSVIGWILLVLCGIMLVLGKNLRQFAFYSDYMVIFALDKSGLCWKIPYRTVKSWHLKHVWAGMHTLYIETEGNTAQKIEAKCYQYHSLKKQMQNHLPKKETASD